MYESQHATQALHVAHDILLHDTPRQLNSLSSKYRSVIEGLYDATTTGSKLPATERLAKLEAARALLNTAKVHVEEGWFESTIEPSLDSARKRIQYSIAMERTENSVLLDENTVLEEKDLQDPKKLMELLESRRGMLIDSLMSMIGMVEKIENSPELQKQATKFLKQRGADVDKLTTDYVKGLALELVPSQIAQC